MIALTAKQMQNIDRRTSDKYGISGYELMLHASQCIFDAIRENLPDYKNKTYFILCGKGNNGGDGYGLARLMYRDGLDVTAYSAADQKDSRSDAAAMKKNFNDAGGRAASIDQFLAHCESIADNTVIIDALFGTGLTKDLEESYLALIHSVNRSGAYIVSVDIPSGLNCDNGMVMGAAVHADLTVTFCCEKPAHILKHSAPICGKIVLKDIGIPDACVQEEPHLIRVYSKEDAIRILPKNTIDQHKGSCGKVLIVGGSKTMSGAPAMAGSAALRSGAGIVKLLVPESVFVPIVSKTTELMCVPMKETMFGTLSKHNLSEILELIPSFDSLVIGCGMSVDENTKELLYGIIRNCEIPMVIDADGLNILAADPSMLLNTKGKIVLTPHEVEMSRLSGSTKETIHSDRIEAAGSFARKYHSTVVLKGSNTVTASANADLYLNTTGNPGMATAGSGDVLSGVIGAFLARGLDSFDAAATGAYIHGLAGDHAAAARSEYGMIASDIIEHLSYVLKLCDSRI